MDFKFTCPMGHAIIGSMYKDYYQLKEEPFNMTADPGFFFSSTRHAEAFSHLIYGIQNRKGILVITGEIGTGKTTLCRTLLNRLDQNIKTALILNPDFSEIQLLQLIIQDLEIRGEFKNKLALINALNHYLLEQTTQGNNVVVIIDEAQNLKPRQLEQVRLLSNLETEKEKLLQIILVGQPELLEVLRLTSLRQLTQRIAVRYHILPLDRNEIKDYIYHRLKVASRNHGVPTLKFTDEAVAALYVFSKGIPRLINILCDRALLAGFVQETFTIDANIIAKCARETHQ
jgi:general secretion pathway protein A